MKKLFIVFILSIVFIGCKKEHTDYSSIEIIDKTEFYIEKNQGWVSLNDKEKIDGYTKIENSIFGGEISCNVEPLKGIDVETFEVLAGTYYARDKNNVYYPLEITCIDSTNCRVCFYAKIILEKSNPKNFSYLGKEYATDGTNVYFRGELIKKADGKTFKIIDAPHYLVFATDKNFVFKHDEIFEEADAETFYYNKNDKRNISKKYEHKFIIGDKNYEWEYTAPNEIKKITDKKIVQQNLQRDLKRMENTGRDLHSMNFIGKTTIELDSLLLHTCWGMVSMQNMMMSQNDYIAFSNVSNNINDCGKGKILFEKEIGRDGRSAIFEITDEINIKSRNSKTYYAIIRLKLESDITEQEYLVEYKDDRDEIITEIYSVWRTDKTNNKFMKIKTPRNLKFENPDWIDCD
jgi:hypothetical protein